MNKSLKAGLCLGVLLLLVGIYGCGGDNASTGAASRPQAFLTSHRLDLVLGDCSTYRGVTKAFVPTMVQIAENSAQLHRALWAACFDGAPLRTLSWNPTIDFGDLPSAVASSPEIARRFNEARALGLEPALQAMVDHTPVRAPGSGQLEALEVAAQTAHVGRVFMFTDAQIDEIGGVNLLTATPKQIAQDVRLWVPRLRTLRHVQLWFIGVGFLAPTSASVRRSEMLFRGIASAVGASCSWSQSLPVSFPQQPATC
jgi:hypothetical protein